MAKQAPAVAGDDSQQGHGGEPGGVVGDVGGCGGGAVVAVEGGEGARGVRHVASYHDDGRAGDVGNHREEVADDVLCARVAGETSAVLVHAYGKHVVEGAEASGGTAAVGYAEEDVLVAAKALLV